MSDDLTPAMLNQKIDSHEKICAERYAGIHDKIGELKKFIFAMIAALASMFVATLGWSLQQQYAAQKATTEALQAKIELLQERAPSNSSTRPQISS